MDKIILVTGATGTIGKELLKQLKEQGACVRIGTRDLKKAEGLDTGNCPVVHFDYNKPQTFKSAFHGVSSLFLVTPMTSRIDELIVPAIDAAKQMGVDHIVSLGSIGSELGDFPLSIAERCVLSCGIPSTILRPNLLMQNFGNLAGSIIKSSGLLYLPANRSRISFIDARDVAAAAASALLDPLHNNHIYTLTGKEALDHYQIAHILSMVSGKTITYIPISHNDAKQQLQRAGWSENDAEIIIGLYEIARKGWCEEVRPDLREILKRDPVSFEQYARDYKENWG